MNTKQTELLFKSRRGKKLLLKTYVEQHSKPVKVNFLQRLILRVSRKLNGGK